MKNKQLPDRIVIAPEERRQTVLEIIGGAKRQLTLSLFRCKDAAIFDALAAAVHRGVAVEAVVTSRAKGGRGKVHQLQARLQAIGAAVHPYSDPVVKYHAKYLVADDGPAVVASLNFTRKCFDKTWDALVVTHDPEVVQGLRHLAAADAASTAEPPLTERLIVGPGRARRQFASIIGAARSTIELIDAKIADPDLVTLLKERRAAGIDVRIHSARRLAGRKSHGKFLLVDGRTAVVGSLALAALSIDFRREVAIVVEEPSAVADVARLFETVSAAEAVAPVPRAGDPVC